LSSSKTSPLVIGHRGASALAPENTLAAFARAFADGADGIEFDVRLARDGVPVVIHDANLRRTGGRKGRVANLTSARLGEIDVGSWFNRRRPRFARLQYTRQTLPTLDGVFRLLVNQSNQELVAYVEIKTARKKRLNERLARSIVDAIERYSLKQRTIVISFNLPVIRMVKQLDPSICTGALFGPRQRASRSMRRIVEAAVRCSADQILLHRTIATRRMVDCARRAKLIPVIWTVDDPKWITRASDRQIYALMSNNPAHLHEFI